MYMMSTVLIAFLASLGLNWPELPMGARLPDVLFVGVLLVMAASLRPFPRLRWHQLDLLVVVYLVGALPSFAVTSSVAGSAVELVRQFYLVGIYAAVAMAVAGGYARVVAIGLACSGAGLACAGVSLLALYLATGISVPAAGEVMSLPYVGAVMRLRAFAMSESMLACVLAMAVPFAIGLAARSASKREQAWWAVAAAAIGVAAALTFSHSIAGVAVAAVAGAWPYADAYPRWRRVAAAGAVAVVLLLNVAATASVRQVAFGEQAFADNATYHYGVDAGRIEAGGVTVDYNLMSYFRLKQIAWAAFAANPVAGVGLDRFHDVSERAFAQGQLTATYQVVDPHSTLMGRLAETGLFGGVTLVLLWAGVLVAAAGAGATRNGRPDQWAAVAVMAGLLGLLVNSLNVDIMNFRFAWVGLGLLRGLVNTGAPRAGV